MIRLYAKYEETVKYFWFAILIERNIFLDFEIGNNKDVLYWHIKMHLVMIFKIKKVECRL